MITVAGYLGRVDPSGATPGIGTPRIGTLAARADLVVGGARALEALAVPPERRVVLGSVAAAIDRLVEHERRPGSGEVLVLASGDPLLYGVVRRLRAAGLACRVLPGVSSVAAAFAAVALPWDDAQIVSAHGFPLRAAVAACRALPKVAVLTGPGRGVRELAAELTDLPRWFVLAERLGETDERVRVLDCAAAREVPEVREPNVVLVLAAPPDAPAALGTPSAFLGGDRRATDLAGAPAADLAADRAVGRAADRAVGQRAALDAALALVIGRHLPVLGDIVWASGATVGPTRDACARTGAAVLDITTELPSVALTSLGGPDLVLLDGDLTPALLADLGARSARLVVHLGSESPPALWPDWVEASIRQVRVADDGGEPHSSYVTTLTLHPQESA